MSILTASRVGKAFGAKDIFSDISVEIPHGAKIALVGPNGAGKTTLINILSGLDDPTSGAVILSRGTSIGYLPQRPHFDSDRTVWGEMLTAFDALRQKEHELSELAHRMGESPDDEAIFEQYGKLQHEFEEAGGYDYETRIRQVLQGLGFPTELYDRPMHQLSGGQKTRALLAKLLLQSPSLLILDEPTNHLDIDVIEWLESFLTTWRESLLVVSHDRYFMDRVVNAVWELEFGKLDTYRGNYSHYVQQREERREQQRAEYESQQAFIEKEEEYIRRNIAGQNTRQAKGRLKRLNRLKRDDIVDRVRDSKELKLNLQAQTRSGDKVLMTKDLIVGYPDGSPLFSVPDLTLFRGEVAAIIGPNGVGKSTFLKTLLNQLEPKSGTSKLGASVKLGYFAQAHELLKPNNSIMDELLTVRNLPISEARNYLGAFLFSGDDVFRQVSTLSGGERGRVALAKLALDGANFLLLDEPTNHLDIASQEVLQEVLDAYEGTILLVSHDRYLIDALATQIWAVSPGKMTMFEGTYQEYLAAREAAKLRAAEVAKPAAKAAPGKQPDPKAKGAKPGGMSQFERQKRVAAVEDLISKLEMRLVELSGELEAASAAGKVDRVRQLGDQYTAAQAELEQRMQEWEDLLAV
jgi:ATP-binding cassette, subfamily F, member 3